MLLDIGIGSGRGLGKIRHGNGLLMQQVDGGIGVTESLTKPGWHENLERGSSWRGFSVPDGSGTGVIVCLLLLGEVVISDVGQDLKHVRIERADWIAEGGKRDGGRKRQESGKRYNSSHLSYINRLANPNKITGEYDQIKPKPSQTQ